jgi:colicin import membrane protein
VLDKRLEAARKRFQEEKQKRHRPGLEADRIRDLAVAKKSRAEREVQAKGHLQYKACFGKCNHPDCRKKKRELFGSDNYCYDPRVLAAAVVTATEKLARAQVAVDAARNDPSFLAAEAKAKVEEETHTAAEVAFASTKATKQEAAVAAAKHTANVRAKEAHQEAAAAKEEAEAQAKAEVEAAASLKRQAEATAKTDAQAEAADKHSNTEAQAREAFFERLPFAAAKAKEAEEKAREALVLEERRQDEQLRAAEAKCRRK